MLVNACPDRCPTQVRQEPYESHYAVEGGPFWSAELVNYHQSGNYFLDLRDILSSKIRGQIIRPLKHVCVLPSPCSIGQLKMVWATLRTHRKTNLSRDAIKHC
jgi:hypothetical protein